MAHYVIDARAGNVVYNLLRDPLRCIRDDSRHFRLCPNTGGWHRADNYL